MRTFILVSAGFVVGYTVRSRRNQAFATVAHRVVDTLFGQTQTI
jgi:hypothetical protein